MLEFHCTRCGKRVPVTTHSPVCECGGLYELDPVNKPFDLKKIDRSTWSLFRYREFLTGLGEAWQSVTLGEGLSPVVELEPGVFLKVDYMMPTLSFKDRGAATLVSHMKAIGVTQCVQDSSGNAGHAVAAYCARAGIACEIYVPEGTSPKKIAMIKATGAACRVIEGSRDHCADVCRARVHDEGVYYANHVVNPFFYEGMKTYIYEVFEQMGRIPEHIIVPVGNGTLYLGVIKALEHLLASGVIDHFPKVIALQSEHCDPLYEAYRENSDEALPVAVRPTIAEGIAIGKPLRAKEILTLARKHNVVFVRAPENRLLAWRERLAKKGFYIEHTTAANFVAWEAYQETYGASSDVLITLCGAGIKSDH